MWSLQNKWSWNSIRTHTWELFQNGFTSSFALHVLGRLPVMVLTTSLVTANFFCLLVYRLRFSYEICHCSSGRCVPVQISLFGTVCTHLQPTIMQRNLISTACVQFSCHLFKTQDSLLYNKFGIAIFLYNFSFVSKNIS